MTIFQQSMLYALLAGIGRLWRESCLGRGFAALVRWLSAKVDESAILWVLCREGKVARAWEESFLCRAISAVVNFPVWLCHRIYLRWQAAFDGSFFANLAFEIGREGAIAESWLWMALWIIPFARWNNAYQFLAGVLLLLCVFLRGMREGKGLDIRAVGFYPVLLFAAICLAVPLSHYPGISGRFLFYHISAALCLLGTVSAVRNSADLKRLAASGGFVVLVTSLYGVYQRIQGVEVNKSYVDTTVNEGMPGRVMSIFDNPNTFAQVLILLLPLLVALTVSSKRWWSRLAAAGTFAVGFAALGMTYSRASWVGLAFAAVVFVVLWNRKLIPFGILAALVVLAILPDTVFNRILTIFNTSDTSTNSRFPLYQAAGEFLQQRPVLGAGLGSDAVRQAIGDLNLFHGKDHFVHCHNIYLQVWCETGLVGVISFVGGILWTFKKGCRAVARATCDPVVRMTILGGAAALMGTMVCGLADYIWNYPRVMLIFWFVCALTLAGIRLAARQDGEETSAPVSE